MRTVAALVSVALSVLGILAATLVGAVPASAATGYVFVANGDGTSWGDAANWAPAGVPGTGASVTVQAPSDDFCRAHLTGIPSGLQLADLTVDEHLFRGDPSSPCLTSLDGGSITVTHSLTFHAGSIDTPITIAAGATATITPGAALDTTHLGGALLVNGSLTVANTNDPQNLSLTGGAITVGAGGTFATTGIDHLTADCCGSVAHLTNNGSVQVGTATVTLDGVELDQNASLTAGGGTVVSLVAPQTAGSGASWNGSGTWRLGHSTVTTARGTQTLASGFTWQFGGHGSTSQEYLRGTFALAGTGTFEWAGGQIDAAMTVGSTSRLVANGTASADRRELNGLDGSTVVRLTNAGTAGFAGGAGWYGVNGGSLGTTSTGTLTLGAGTAIAADCCGTQATIVNSGGRVVVPASAGKVTLANAGYRAAGGTLQVGSGSDLEVSGLATSSLSSTTINGGGTVGFASPVDTGGTVTVGTTTTLQLRPLSAVATAGNTTTTVNGAGSVVWSGGTVTGHLTLATTGGQVVTGATRKSLRVPTGAPASVLTFAGPTTVQAGTSTASDLVAGDPSSQLVFTGRLSLAALTQVTGAAVTTSGTTTVAASTGRARVDTGATLTNSGTLIVAGGTLATDATVRQTAGTTTLAAGATLAAPTFQVTGGTLTGAGTLTGGLAVTAGTVDPAGTLTVTGAVTLTSASTLHVDVAATTHDVLAVGGSATLAGTVVAADASGYTPTTGATLSVVTAPSLTAGFTTVTSTGTGATAQHWTAAVATNPVRLQLTSAAGAA